MAPDALIPTPDTLQVDWGWFQVLLTLTWVIHILIMNALFGGSVVSLIGGLRKTGPAAMAAQTTATKVPTLIALTVNAGVAPLLFMQVLFGHFFYTSSVVMANWWFAVIPILILGYYAAYRVALKYDGSGRNFLSVVVLVALLYVSFMFVTNSVLALKPDAWTAYFEHPDGSVLPLNDATLWPRWLHMVFGAIAVGGLFVAFLQDLKVRRGDTHATAARDWALPFFNYGSLVTIVIGFWWLMALPKPVMMRFMGQDMISTGLLTIGLVIGILAVVLGFMKKVRPAAVVTVLTVIVMALMRESVRLGYLDGLFHPSELKVTPQISPMILFVGVFLIGIVCVIYMLKLAARAGKAA